MNATRLGRFHLLAPLGQGAIGRTYKAHDERSGRTLAIKVLDPNLLRDAARRASVLRVARGVSALSHPNLAALFEVAEVDGQPVLAFEYVEGQTLDALCSGRPLVPRRAIEIGHALAHALAHVHDRDLVHGDVRPANVRVSRTGRPKFLDTGLAAFTAGGRARRHLASAPDAATDLPRGIPEHLSPEEATGECATASSDVFALGVMLYEMLTGRLPFQGRCPAETLVALLTARPRPPSGSVPGLPGEIDAIVAGCLARPVDARLASGDVAIGLWPLLSR